LPSPIVGVISLVVLTLWQGPEILETWIHPASGMMTFALSLPLIFWLGGQARPAAPVVQTPVIEARP